LQGDQPDGSFSADEFARLEASGLIEAATPGTPEAAAFDRALIDELDAADAEQITLQGTDAFTSARLLRQMAIAAERDPTRVGYAFAAWCRSRGWERSDLAERSGADPGWLAAVLLGPGPAEER
jgi:hypothetical protein